MYNKEKNDFFFHLFPTKRKMEALLTTVERSETFGEHPPVNSGESQPSQGPIEQKGSDELKIDVNQSSNEHACLVCLKGNCGIALDPELIKFSRDEKCIAECKPEVCTECQPSLKNCPLCRQPDVDVEGDRWKKYLVGGLIFAKMTFDVIIFGMMIVFVILASFDVIQVEGLQRVFMTTYLLAGLAVGREFVVPKLPVQKVKRLAMLVFYLWNFALAIHKIEMIHFVNVAHILSLINGGIILLQI